LSKFRTQTNQPVNK